MMARLKIGLLPPRTYGKGPAPTAEQVVGTWLISATKQIFDLKITSITGNRIWYTMSMDGRPRLGICNPLTGSISFTHTGLDGDEREFHGNLRIVGGKFKGSRSSELTAGGSDVGTVSLQVFSATKK